MTAGAGPASDVARVAGWYGKLPTVGDFASRRLEADFIDPWDRWLADGLQAQRDVLGDAWLDAFLHSPSWRFILTPGVLPGFDARTTLAGVVMPSVDRVGRYFPLTLTGAIGRLPASATEFDAVFAWIDRLENTALEALHADWSIDELEDALRMTVGAPAEALYVSPDDPFAHARESLAEALAVGGGSVDVAPVAQRADLASVFAGVIGGQDTVPAPRRVVAEARGVAFWMADGAPSPQLLVSTGLPGPDAFLHLFGSSDGTRPGSPDVRTGEAAAPLLASSDLAVDAPVIDPLVDCPQRQDILTLFGASEEAAVTALLPAAAPLAAAVAHEDLLALFDKASPSAGTSEAEADASALQADANEIIGLLGDIPATDPPDR